MSGFASEGSARERGQQEFILFDIPEQKADQALVQFAEQAGVTFVFPYDKVREQTANAVYGRLSRKVALQRLLAGTGLTAEFGDSGVVEVRLFRSDITEKEEKTMQNKGIFAGLFGALLGSSSLAPATAATLETAIDEITVTATKREDLLSRTPMAVSVLTGKDIKALGIDDFNDIATNVPGISLQTFGAGTVQINMRGISTGGGVSPTVGVYIDDVAYNGGSVGLASSFDPKAVDFQRIEVLRGPQGTLYGASTMGGLLKFVSAKPDSTAYSGSASVDVSGTKNGDLNEEIQASLNAPLVEDKVAMRVSGYYAHDGGYIDNIVGEKNANEAEIYGGRVDVLFTPSDPLSIRIGLYGQNINRDGHADAGYDLATGEPVYGKLVQWRLTPEPFTQHYRLASGTIDYDFGFADLTSITSYQESTTDQLQDASYYFPALLGPFGLTFEKYSADTQIETKTFTEEVRLTSKSGTDLEWIVGGYYTHIKNHQYQSVQPLNNDDSAVDGFDLLTVNLNGKVEEIAGFGDITYHFTPKFDATIGVRVARTKVTSNQVGSGLLIGSAPPGKSTETVATYLFNPRYQINEQTMVYARVASSYRPGGPNISAIDPNTGLAIAPPTYDSDKLWSYETGFKMTSEDNRYSIDVGAFYIDWSDIQIIATRNGVGVVDNATKARSKGVEASFSALPVDGLQISGNVAYTDPELTEASPDLGGAKGERLPDTAKFTAAVRADYSFPVTGDILGSIGGSFRYVGARYASFNASASNPNYRLPSYTITDLRAGLDFGDIQATVYVDNVFDNRGVISAYTGFATVGAAVQAAIIQPRKIGASLDLAF